MKRAVFAVLLSGSASLFAQVPAARVAADAKVIDRVAEASRKDLPHDLVKRILNEDIEILRNKRTDGTYQYAGYDRMESGRKSDSFSVDPEKKEAILELHDSFAYRLVINMPSRRMLVTHNRHLYVDHVEIEYIPLSSSEKKFQTVKVEAWLEPGTSKVIDFTDIARQATARVYAHADKDGYGNIELTLIEARIFDDPNSPYADAVESAKAILRAVDHDDIGSIRSMAQRIASALQPAAPPVGAPPPAIAAIPATREIEVTAPKGDGDLYAELQAIEDLLTGTEAEKRQGTDRLHQLLRRLRPQSR